MFATYVKLYYDFAFSSVYFVDTEHAGFNACFLVKKAVAGLKEVRDGCWDGIHVVACDMSTAGQAKYRVISTVMISVESESADIGTMSIHGSSSKTREETFALPVDSKSDLDQFHLRNIGKMIETNEGTLREEVTEHYVGKQRQITNTGRL